MRGKNGGLQAVFLAKLLASRYLPRAQYLIKKQTVPQELVALLHLRGLGVLHDEVWVVNTGTGDEKLMNSLMLWQCSWMSSIFYGARGYVICGHLDVPM